MEKHPKTLSPMRRRAVDRLLAQYLELPEAAQDGFVRSCGQRFPRLSAWLVRVISATGTISLVDGSMHKLASSVLSSEGAATERLPSGSMLGPWQIVDFVGEGGMGRVYRGRRGDDAFEMDVAIKLIANRRRGLARLLQRECQLLARLDHPVITRLLDAGLDDQAGPFLVMEWVEGQDLQSWLADSPSINERLRVIEDLGQALAHAHQRLIAHGDLKPANVRIRFDGQVRLLDFGIARLMDDTVAHSESPAALTPNFAAPEQLGGDPPTPATDLWTLGSLAIWMLCGQAPDQSNRWKRLIRDQYPRHRDLIAILSTACSDDPQQRYVSVSGFIADLRRYRQIEPVSVRPGSPLYTLQRFVVRRRALSSSLAAILLLLASGILTTTNLYFQADAERARSDIETEKTQQVVEFLVDLFQSADPRHAQGEEVTVREVVQRGSERVKALDAGSAVQSELLSVLGRVNMALGRFSESAELLSRAIAILEQDEDHDSAQLASLYARLGSALHEAGDLTRAAEHHQTAVEHAENVDDLLLADTLSRLGMTQRRLGDLAQAEKHYRRALEIWRRVAPGSIDLAVSLNNLAIVLALSDRSEEAFAHFEESLDLHILELGENHPLTINTMGNLGAFYSNSGRYDKAEPLILETLERRIDVLGPDHPAVASTMHSAGLLYYRVEDFDQAEEYWQRALQLREAAQGEDHYSLVTTLLSLSVLARNQANLEQAQQLINRSLAIARTHYGASHATIARALQEKALLADDRELPKRALSLGHDALAMSIEIHGPEHSRVGLIKKMLAKFYLKQDHFRNAEALAAQAHQIFKNIDDGLDNPNLTETKRLQGAIEEVQNASN